MTNTEDTELRRLKAIVNTFHRLRGEVASELNAELELENN